jgi:ribosomal protein S18 acetylase RimI-like enzyme
LHEEIVVRHAAEPDMPSMSVLMLEWLSLPLQRDSVFRDSTRREELLVAERDGALVGFLHHVMHNDVIDGGLNSFITALYVSPFHRRKGIASLLLRTAIRESLKKRAVGMEASTTNPEARRLYEKFGFRQFRGEVFLEMDMNKAREA